MRPCATHHHACDCRERMFTRALEIADEAMMDQLLCHSLPDEAIRCGGGGVLALTDQDGDEVRALSDADPAVQEALEWLLERKLAELITADDGAECIYLPPNVGVIGFVLKGD